MLTNIASYGNANVHGEIGDVYQRYSADREDVLEKVYGMLSNQYDTVVFEFDIPGRRKLYCAGIASNMVVLASIGRDSAIFRTHIKDMARFDKVICFKEALRAYNYERLSVSTGPKYVYVSVCGMFGRDRCYKFDFPWWITSDRWEMPSGMLIGLNQDDAVAWQLYTSVFRYYIYPHLEADET